MAVVRQRATKRKRTGNKGAGAAGLAVTAEPRARANGAERLKKAADRRLARKSEELADVLMDKALEGKLDSARFLVTLAEGKKPPAKKNRHPNEAEVMASEPEWDGTAEQLLRLCPKAD